MPRLLNVYALPGLIDPGELVGGTAVVIDVLRASTTIVHALCAGAREVIPCEEVDEAWALAAALPTNDVLLGGERKGIPIEGFDLGNSPEEYTPERVNGRTIVFTTTNGTRAIKCASEARRVLIGGFVNVSAILQELIHTEQIHLVCAATAGQIGRDDVLLAGMLVDRIMHESGMIGRQNAQAIVAREEWLAAFAVPTAIGGERLEPHQLADQLCKSPGGRNLTAIGHRADIDAAAWIDRFDCVPVFDPEKNRICLA
ncbi:MAG: 2-phosphosulfolactate phosphatase [Candidatus Nealsonbacteria bacterium]|nr:2-phosphosulfolactate phosphatase [Candidatus Nealsonbacteria bacterium]